MAKDISRTLVVGLGGTGQAVIREIKKRLLRSYGEIPKLVRFLEFDTDENDTKGGAYKYYYKGHTYKDFKYQIQNSEFLLTPFLGVGLAEKDPICNVKIRIEELSKVSHRLNNKGAGGYRVCGRTIFLQNAEKIIKVLKNTISGDNGLRNTGKVRNEISRGYNLINGGYINVFVVASLAGGTGSSAFMDMSRMLQIAGIHVDNQAGMGQDQIFGMFFLPNFFEGNTHTQNIRVNAYTALSELDYTWGLNDGSKYKAGCRDLAMDEQEYSRQGGYDNKKRVVFTSVCLIDALTSQNQVNSFSDAAGHVASFIAASIAADNNAIISSFANSDHKLKTVDGKYQNYSGIGYCELRFNRQDLVKYLLNRKLITALEDYKNGTNERANEIAEKFIKGNSLNEGVMKNGEGLDTRAQLNELTDAIVKMSDPRFGNIYMNAVDTSDNADSLIESSKIQYLNDITTLAQTMVNEFSPRKEQILANLRTLLNDHQYGNGFGQFPDIARQLRTSFVAMMEGLIAEKKQHAEEFLAIEKELSTLKNYIKDNNPGGRIGRGHRSKQQASWLDVYSNKVRFEMGNSQNPTLARLKVEDIRKTEAVSLYEKMIQLVDEFYKSEKKSSIDGPKRERSGSFLKVEDMFDSLMEALTLENDNYNPSQAAVKETLYADAYFKEYFEHDPDAMPLSEHAINELNTYFKGVFTEMSTIDSEKLLEMRQKLLKLLPSDGKIKKIQEERMSIDEVFLGCYGKFGEIENPNDLDKNPQLKMLQQLESMFDPMWKHMPFAEGLAPENNMIVGVNDIDNHIFNDDNGYSEKISGWNSGQRKYVSLGDPDRIVFMLMETAVPVHMIAGVSDWANEYIHSDTYTFSDKRLEGIEMAMPGAQDECEIAWAYGWLFGLITNPTNRKALRVKPSYELRRKRNYHPDPKSDGEVNYFNIEKAKDIAACHQKFINDQELAMDILDQAMAMLDSNPIDTIIKIKEWINDRKMWSAEIRGKQEENLTVEEYKVIDNEKAFLAMRFSRLGEEYGLELRGDLVVHTESMVLSQREAELKDQ